MSISCKVCGEEFKTNVLLIRHRRYQSRRCEEYKIHSNCLSGSLISYLGKNSVFTDIKCSRCVKTFFNRKHLSIHMRIHTKRAPYKCDFCSKTFILMLHLYYHLDSHRGEESKGIKCMKCRSKLQELLKKLNLNGSTINTFRCWFCNKRRFSNVVQLLLHLRTTHCLQMSVCSDCGNMSITVQDIVSYLKSRSALTQTKAKQCHPTVMNGARNHQCESCGRTFEKIHLLEIHLLSHISDPLFCCRNCQEVFRNGQLYVMHIKKCLQKKALPSSAKFFTNHFTATGDETFDCPYCTLCFASSSQLQSHLPFHVGAKDSRSDTESADEDFIVEDQSETEMNSDHVRTFICSNCKRAFKKNEDLTVHVKTGCPRTYSCRLCFKIFGCLSDLQNHMRNYHLEALDQELYEQAQPSSRLLNQNGQCYKSFVNNVSTSSSTNLPVSDGGLSSGIGTNRISSNSCNPGYFDSLRDPEHCENGNDFNSQSEEHFLCDICGEVLSDVVDFEDHLNRHVPQEFCDQIYTMANMNPSRQPDINQSQPSWMMLQSPENLPSPYFMPNNTRIDNNFSSGPDMNPYFTRTENMNPMSHRIGFPLSQQINNVTVPTFSTANGIPFIPSVNELKSLPYSESVPPGFAFSLQNGRGNFFAAPNLADQSSTSNLPYEDCRDNNLMSDNNSRLNAFYSIPPQGNVLLANTKDKNNNLKRNVPVSPIISEKRNSFFSTFTLPQNNENLGTVSQKTNANISHSTSDYELQTSFILERENFISNPSTRNGTCLDNNIAPFPVSFSESKNSGLTSTKQNDSTECSPLVPLQRNPNNMETHDSGYPSVNELVNFPNLQQGQHLPEMKPLNLCQTNLETGKFYNYSGDQDWKGFNYRQSPLTNIPVNIQTPYPVPHFWEESKFSFDFEGNPCLSSENESVTKYNSGLQMESVQSPLWVEPNYNMNLKQFQEPSSGQVDDKIVKIRTNSTSYLEDQDGKVDSLYDSQNNTRN